MYYLEHGLKQKWLGVLFAIFGSFAAFGIGNGTQSKAVADAMNNTFNVPFWLTGVVLMVLAGLVIFVGIYLFGRFIAFFVLILSVFYLAVGVVFVVVNFVQVPAAFGLIFNYAFSGEALAGGTVGAVIRAGIARGLFSNEAGLGSAPIA